MLFSATHTFVASTGQNRWVTIIQGQVFRASRIEDLPKPSEHKSKEVIWDAFYEEFGND